MTTALVKSPQSASWWSSTERATLMVHTINPIHGTSDITKLRFCYEPKVSYTETKIRTLRFLAQLMEEIKHHSTKENDI